MSKSSAYAGDNISLKPLQCTGNVYWREKNHCIPAWVKITVYWSKQITLYQGEWKSLCTLGWVKMLLGNFDNTALWICWNYENPKLQKSKKWLLSKNIGESVKSGNLRYFTFCLNIDLKQQLCRDIHSMGVLKRTCGITIRFTKVLKCCYAVV